MSIYPQRTLALTVDGLMDSLSLHGIEDYELNTGATVVVEGSIE